ncbi:hypothetical protein M409DRAFT_19695 [Zasmidium cellare ATCC 36951]|uniref:F-box domain-containing protein n=1 Tax=Zasmidium cellare ATCC 36951 TaxID=1080233 RepID=A0A6A6CV72_ZASCE|nr:uncharacterized protein M409DRAFT_19695 [Zasmidium cellare ATCC 36951]KAF2170088.1 hypothetical protein M409DRAFT_19695 [Zasmidium cellare ATCC 36951]
MKKAGGGSERLHLLALPPEIRTTIFEYALTEPDKIKIRPTLRPPALLSTCRQTREDAGLIWWERNRFVITIWNCNASLLAAFSNLHHTHQRRYDLSGHLVYHIVVEGGKDWNNLVAWCYEVWANTIPAYKMLEPSDDFEAFVSVATNIAKWHRDRPWEECFATIDAIRYAVAKYDRAWAQSRDQHMGRG